MCNLTCYTFAMKYDVLAIGDTTIDAFIKLKDARVHCNINDEDCELCVRFGDKVPYESVDIVPGVGNSANAAVACARLGLKTALRVHIGNDANGDDCMETWKKADVITDLVVRENDKKTNYHYVLMYEAERTILIKHEEYAYTFPELPDPPKWIYLSSLGNGTLPYQQQIADYCAAHPEVKLAFQPGTFQIKMSKELKDIYAHSEIFFCNKEEAQKILETAELDIKKLLSGLRSLGPKIAVITDGRKGAYVMTDAGAWSVPMYPDPAPPISRTGAGDATASTMTAFIEMGMEPQNALLRGVINSASVVQGVGAQKCLLTKDQIEEWYAKRPADFKATEI